MVLLLAAMIMQPAGQDPLSDRMYQLCRGKPSCVARQKDGVRRFLRIITAGHPPQSVIRSCLADATRKKRQTDWSKAAVCLEHRTPKTPARRTR